MLCQEDFLVIQEDELNLGNGQNHSCCRCYCYENVLALAITFQLKVLAKFKATVDHAPDPECHDSDAQIKASVANWFRLLGLCIFCKLLR